MAKRKCSFQGSVGDAYQGGVIPDPYFKKRLITVKEEHARFATELKPGSMSDCLWAPDGSRASTIVIRKEIWNDNGGADGSTNFNLHPVFHVENNLDPSKSIPGTGGRVNPYDKPFRTLREALKVAKHHFDAALASGRWVPVAEVRRTYQQ